MEHTVSFEEREARFIITDIECDLKLVGFIPCDKSLPLKSLTPMKFVSGDNIFLRLAKPMINNDVDGVVLGDTYYILRAFRHQGKYLLALCKTINPTFQSEQFDGQLFINPGKIFSE